MRSRNSSRRVFETSRTKMSRAYTGLCRDQFTHWQWVLTTAPGNSGETAALTARYETRQLNRLQNHDKCESAHRPDISSPHLCFRDSEDLFLTPVVKCFPNSPEQSTSCTHLEWNFASASVVFQRTGIAIRMNEDQLDMWHLFVHEPGTRPAPKRSIHLLRSLL